MKELLMAALMATAAVGVSGAGLDAHDPQSIEVTLERYENGAWKAVDARMVLSENDRVRFRYRANFNGYLFVKNRGSGGTDQLLFPRDDVGTENRVEAGRQYVFPPAENGAFTVGGPPGFDVIVWIVKPVNTPEPDGSTHGVFPTFRPSCNSELLKTTGQCLDQSAGLQFSLPERKARGLMFSRVEKTTVISAAASLEGPMSYQFWLAHR